MPEALWTVLCGVFLCAGVLCMRCGVAGVYRFRFVLNRMHSAGILDTLGIFLILLGLAFASHSMEYLPKLLLILAALWVGSPIASHLVSRMEYLTDEDAKNHFREEDRT